MKKQHQNPKQHPSLSENFRQILADIAEIANLKYFEGIIGYTKSIYLLAYLAGLIICRLNVTMTGISYVLKLCHHDSLYRMLAGIKLTGRMFSSFFIGWIITNRKQPGWLILDDTVITKEYSKAIECAGYCWSSKLERSVMGIHIVTLYWSDGTIRIPVGYRLWLPEGKAKHYRTKVELAIELLSDNEEFCQTCSYITFDTWYCALLILRICAHMGLRCNGQLRKNRWVIFKKRKIQVCSFSMGLHQVDLPGFGTILVYVDRFCHGVRYLMDTDTSLSPGEVKSRYNSRWAIEECFRFMKLRLGLTCCQCRIDVAQRNHISLVFLAHFVMEVLSVRLNMNVYKTSDHIVNLYYGIKDKPPKLRQRKAFLKLVA